MGRYYEPQSDWSSEEGAKLLARKINEYWKGRGFPSITTGVIETTVDAPVWKNSKPTPMPVFSVISNIGPSGFPPPI